MAVTHVPPLSGLFETAFGRSPLAVFSAPTLLRHAKPTTITFKIRYMSSLVGRMPIAGSLFLVKEERDTSLTTLDRIINLFLNSSKLEQVIHLHEENRRCNNGSIVVRIIRIELEIRRRTNARRRPRHKVHV